MGGQECLRELGQLDWPKSFAIFGFTFWLHFRVQTEVGLSCKQLSRQKRQLARFFNLTIPARYIFFRTFRVKIFFNGPLH